MKLLIFIDTLGLGGAERFASTFANHWARIGWKVTLVTTEKADQDAYDIDDAVERVSLGGARASAGPFAAILSIAARAMALRAIMVRTRPNLVLGITPQPSILVGLARLGLGIPAVGAERTYPPMLPMNARWKALRRAVYPTLDHIVIQTEAGAAWIRRHVGVKRVTVIPNPIPYPLVPGKPHVGIPEDLRDRPVLLAVGRLNREKQFDQLISTFADLSRPFPDWTLVILGEGPERASLERLRDACGLAGRVLLPGRVGNLGDWYRSADLFALTSRFEGFPNALAEAMAHGLPAVSYDCLTGPRDIIRQDIDGLLVPPDNRHALAQALATLMSDHALRRSMGERAKDVRTRFSAEHVLARWEAVLRNLI